MKIQRDSMTRGIRRTMKRIVDKRVFGRVTSCHQSGNGILYRRPGKNCKQTLDANLVNFRVAHAILHANTVFVI
jgi:hypothetical protein